MIQRAETRIARRDQLKHPTLASVHAHLARECLLLLSHGGRATLEGYIATRIQYFVPAFTETLTWTELRGNQFVASHALKIN